MVRLGGVPWAGACFDRSLGANDEIFTPGVLRGGENVRMNPRIRRPATATDIEG